MLLNAMKGEEKMPIQHVGEQSWHQFYFSIKTKQDKHERLFREYVAFLCSLSLRNEAKVKQTFYFDHQEKKG